MVPARDMPPLPGAQLQRYWLFAGLLYYPFGGWRDFRGSFATLAEALEAADPWQRYDTWYQIVDSVTLAMSASSARQP